MGKILGEGDRQKFGAAGSRDRNDSVSSHLEHEPKLPHTPWEGQSTPHRHHLPCMTLGIGPISFFIFFDK